MAKRSHSDGRVDRGAGAPRWWLPASAGVLVLTLLFFMGLVLLAISGREIPPNSRFLVIFILAIAAGLGAAGLGGYASLEGKLPLWADKSPVAVSVGGGIAVMILMLFLGDRVLPSASPSQKTDLRLDSVKGTVLGDASRIQIDAQFRRMALSADRRLSLLLGKTETCDPFTFRALVDSPAQGNMVVFLNRAKSEVTCAELVLEDTAGTVTERGPVTPIDWR
jgi:hypothetical protein